MLLRFVAAPRVLMLSAQTASRFSTAVSVPASLIKIVRETSGAGFLECKNALTAVGDQPSDDARVAAAVEWLRKKGIATAVNLGKKGRVASQGLISVTNTSDNITNSAAIVEFNSETDFVARNDMFKALANQLAASALRFLPDSTTGSTEHPTGFAHADDATLEAFKASKLHGDGAATVDQAVLELVGKIREQMVVRRIAKVTVPNGVVASYIHNSLGAGLGTLGVIVGLRGASGDIPAEHKPAAVEFAKKVAMQIAASKPRYLTQKHVPQAVIDNERNILKAQTEGSGKTEAIVARIIEGRLSKFYSETVLPDQPFFLDPEGGKVSKSLGALSKKVGMPLELAGWVNFAIGSEGSPQ